MIQNSDAFWTYQGLCLSNISDSKTFATEGPDRGVIETIAGLVLWHVFSQDRNGSLSKPLAAT